MNIYIKTKDDHLLLHLLKGQPVPNNIFKNNNKISLFCDDDNTEIPKIQDTTVFLDYLKLISVKDNKNNLIHLSQYKTTTYNLLKILKHCEFKPLWPDNFTLKVDSDYIFNEYPSFFNDITKHLFINFFSVSENQIPREEKLLMLNELHNLFITLIKPFKNFETYKIGLDIFFAYKKYLLTVSPTYLDELINLLNKTKNLDSKLLKNLFIDNKWSFNIPDDLHELIFLYIIKHLHTSSILLDQEVFTFIHQEGGNMIRSLDEFKKESKINRIDDLHRLFKSAFYLQLPITATPLLSEQTLSTFLDKDNQHLLITYLKTILKQKSNYSLSFIIIVLMAFAKYSEKLPAFYETLYNDEEFVELFINNINCLPSSDDKRIFDYYIKVIQEYAYYFTTSLPTFSNLVDIFNNSLLAKKLSTAAKITKITLLIDPSFLYISLIITSYACFTLITSQSKHSSILKSFLNKLQIFGDTNYDLICTVTNKLIHTCLLTLDRTSPYKQYETFLLNLVHNLTAILKTIIEKHSDNEFYFKVYFKVNFDYIITYNHHILKNIKPYIELIYNTMLTNIHNISSTDIPYMLYVINLLNLGINKFFPPLLQRWAKDNGRWKEHTEYLSHICNQYSSSPSLKLHIIKHLVDYTTFTPSSLLSTFTVTYLYKHDQITKLTDLLKSLQKHKNIKLDKSSFVKKLNDILSSYLPQQDTKKLLNNLIIFIDSLKPEIMINFLTDKKRILQNLNKIATTHPKLRSLTEKLKTKIIENPKSIATLFKEVK